MRFHPNPLASKNIERKGNPTSWVGAYTGLCWCEKAKVFTKSAWLSASANFMIGFCLSISGTLITIDYMNRSNQQAHEWWKDSLDDNQRQMRLSSVRASLRHQYAVAWRRNLVRLGILVAIPVVFRLMSVL